MRFGIRDLLLATTFVAIYAAGFAHLSRLGGQPVRPYELMGGLVMLTTMAATILWLGWRSYRRAGTPLVTWPMSNWWVPHTMFLMLFVGCLGFCTWRGSASGGIGFPLIIAFQQFAFLFNRWISLSHEGVLLGLAFISWERCEMRFAEDQTHVELSTRGQLFPPQWPIKKQRLAVPAEKRDEAREALALIRTDIDSGEPG